MINLSRKKLFLFDLDGVLVAGKEDLRKLGGTKVIERIRSKGGGRKLLVLTNDSTDTVGTIYRRLEKLGIPVREDEILTSARLAAKYVAERHPGGTFFLVGEGGLQEELEMRGLKRARAGSGADAVVVGLDRGLTYDRLNEASEQCRNGASLVACHAAKLFMYRDGPAMAVGPIVKAIEFASGRRATVIGKPSRLMFRLALRQAGCNPAQAVMVGDQEDTDVEGARRSGIQCVLVRTGVYSGKEKTRADAVVDNVDDLAKYA